MSNPLVPFHNALYTQLDTVSGITVYSFLPDAPDFPYVYIERKQLRGQDTNRDQVRYSVRSKLLVVTNSDDINEIAGHMSDIEAALVVPLTLADNWTIYAHSPVPDQDVFPIQNFDGSQGHAAEIFHDFHIHSTS